MKLTAKVILLLLSVCIVIMSINGLIENNRMSRDLRNESDILHRTLVENSSFGLSKSVFDFNEPQAKTIISSFFKSQSMYSVSIFLDDGTLFISAERKKDGTGHYFLSAEEFEEKYLGKFNRYKDKLTNFLQRSRKTIDEETKAELIEASLLPIEKLSENSHLFQTYMPLIFKSDTEERVGYLVARYDKTYVEENIYNSRV